MKYKVIWRHGLLHQLTELYVQVREAEGDTSAITQAMAQAETLLERAPETRGESRVHGERVIIVGPLTLWFEVHEDEKVVVVLKCRYHPRAK